MGANVTIPPTRIKVGTYTGNGAATQAITGVGFQPDILVIVAHNYVDNIAIWVTDKQMPTGGSGKLAKRTTTDGSLVADMIRSLDADGFTVGDGTTIGDNELNVNNVDYSYWAFKGY